MTAVQHTRQQVFRLESPSPISLPPFPSQLLNCIKLFFRNKRLVRVEDQDIAKVYATQIGLILKDIPDARPRALAAVTVSVASLLQTVCDGL